MKTSPLNHIVRLSKRLNEAVDQEGKSPFATVLEDFGRLWEIGIKLCLFAGIVPLVGYLIGTLQFYPAGVAIGETFFFLMVAFAFGTAYLLFIGAGFLVAVLLWHAWKDSGNRTALKVGLVILGLMLIVLFVWLRLPIVLGVGIVGFTLAGWCLVILVRDLDNPKDKRLTLPAYRALWLGILICPIIFASSFLRAMNENVVMPNVGLRSINVTLKLSEENYNILSSATRGQHLAALGCSTTASGEPDRLIHGVNLLWHGLGERSLIEIPALPKSSTTKSNLQNHGQNPGASESVSSKVADEKKGATKAEAESAGLRVELKREGIFALHNFSGVIERCLELNGDVLFEQGTAKLLSGKTDLDEMLDLISTQKENIENILVVGHSDAVGNSGSARKNNVLAQNRADEIKKRIVVATGIESSKIDAVEHGAREPKTLCKDWPIKATIGECLAVNRRVEVRIKFVSSSNKNNAEKSSQK